MSDNPYQTPAVSEVAAPLPSDIREIRERHIKHEASLKAVGFLSILGGVMLLGAFAFLGLEVVAARSLGTSPATNLLFSVGLGTLQVISGIGLRRLQGWARIPAAIVAAVAMVSIPVGTLVGVYILYLLFTPKGSMVLSAEYRDIVILTPDIRYRTSRWFWYLLLAVVLIFAGVVAYAFFFVRPR
ncbi:hypothetical protein OKA05_00595 [Luteolibacter arcticus]|uniref:Uncharacterized protein n=1 Tax=Luteolibacter arcticus TaxID=1581411 RepID=A0ABT3GBN3_9BACT|nr:hypothetical protein [Luteolibacter arcticus]MCW1921030.1 hypothetical protein [Luteolibacter arcticus]